jgi:hypothetical protein
LPAPFQREGFLQEPSRRKGRANGGGQLCYVAKIIIKNKTAARGQSYIHMRWLARLDIFCKLLLFTIIIQKLPETLS